MKLIKGTILLIFLVIFIVAGGLYLIAAVLGAIIYIIQLILKALLYLVVLFVYLIAKMFGKDIY